MLGANVSQQFGIRGDIAEVLVFNSAPDTATRTNIENYLNFKWAGVMVGY